jgi:hypothetical protein
MLLRPGPADRNTVFNRGTLFVVVPCLDHYEWQKIVSWEILAP